MVHNTKNYTLFLKFVDISSFFSKTRQNISLIHIEYRFVYRDIIA